jgi:hypothetical protein
MVKGTKCLVRNRVDKTQSFNLECDSYRCLDSQCYGRKYRAFHQQRRNHGTSPGIMGSGVETFHGRLGIVQRSSDLQHESVHLIIEEDYISVGHHSDYHANAT